MYLQSAGRAKIQNSTGNTKRLEKGSSSPFKPKKHREKFYFGRQRVRLATPRCRIQVAKSRIPKMAWPLWSEPNRVRLRCRLLRGTICSRSIPMPFDDDDQSVGFGKEVKELYQTTCNLKAMPQPDVIYSANVQANHLTFCVSQQGFDL